MKLCFPESEISRLAEQYLPYLCANRPEHYQLELKLTAQDLVDQVQQQGYLDRELLIEVAKWLVREALWEQNTCYIKKNCENDVDVTEITEAALKTQDERVRWKVLTNKKVEKPLYGVGPPTASAILHLFHKERYPMNTSYARQAFCGLENENYSSFDFWQRYVVSCRDIADRNKVCMRTLDRAKWMYSEKNQKKKR